MISCHRCRSARPWFTAALATEAERAQVNVEGTPIAYRAWGWPGGGAGIVLVHGAAAHSRWWDHIAPLMAQGRGWPRSTCPGTATAGGGIPTAWTRGRVNCSPWPPPAGITAPPTVIGHSMGGFVTLRLAGLYGARIAGAVAIDSPVRDLTPEEQAAARAPGLRAAARLSVPGGGGRPVPSVPDQPMLRYITRPSSPRHPSGTRAVGGPGSSTRVSSPGRSSARPC